MIPTNPTAIIICGRGQSFQYFQHYHTGLLHRHGADRLQVWGLNERRVPFETMTFEIHEPRHHHTTRKDIPWIIHPHGTPKYPNELNYPIDFVRSQTGQWCNIASAFCYALALAAAFRPEELALPGCDLREEMQAGRWRELACARFWLGILAEQGVRFIYDERWCALFDGEIYQ